MKKTKNQNQRRQLRLKNAIAPAKGASEASIFCWAIKYIGYSIKYIGYSIKYIGYLFLYAKKRKGVEIEIL